MQVIGKIKQNELDCSDTATLKPAFIEQNFFFFSKITKPGQAPPSSNIILPQKLGMDFSTMVTSLLFNVNLVLAKSICYLFRPNKWRVECMA